MVRFDSRLREVVGGSQVALNIRTLALALRRARRLEVEDLRGVVARLMDRLPVAKLYKRKPGTDHELRRFIRTELSKNPSARATPLLRQWRTMGRACEQGRFKTLFEEAARRGRTQSQPKRGS